MTPTCWHDSSQDSRFGAFVRYHQSLVTDLSRSGKGPVLDMQMSKSPHAAKSKQKAGGVSHLEVLHGCHAAIGLKDAARPTLHLLSGVIPKHRLYRLQSEVLSLKFGLPSAIMNCSLNL